MAEVAQDREPMSLLNSSTGKSAVIANSAIQSALDRRVASLLAMTAFS